MQHIVIDSTVLVGPGGIATGSIGAVLIMLTVVVGGRAVSHKQDVDLAATLVIGFPVGGLVLLLQGLDGFRRLHKGKVIIGVAVVLAVGSATVEGNVVVGRRISRFALIHQCLRVFMQDTDAVDGLLDRFGTGSTYQQSAGNVNIVITDLAVLSVVAAKGHQRDGVVGGFPVLVGCQQNIGKGGNGLGQCVHLGIFMRGSVFLSSICFGHLRLFLGQFRLPRHRVRGIRDQNDIHGGTHGDTRHGQLHISHTGGLEIDLRSSLVNAHGTGFGILGVLGSILQVGIGVTLVHDQHDAAEDLLPETDGNVEVTGLCGAVRIQSQEGTRVVVPPLCLLDPTGLDHIAVLGCGADTIHDLVVRLRILNDLVLIDSNRAAIIVQDLQVDLREIRGSVHMNGHRLIVVQFVLNRIGPIDVDGDVQDDGHLKFHTVDRQQTSRDLSHTVGIVICLDRNGNIAVGIRCLDYRGNIQVRGTKLHGAVRQINILPDPLPCIVLYLHLNNRIQSPGLIEAKPHGIGRQLNSDLRTILIPGVLEEVEPLSGTSRYKSGHSPAHKIQMPGDRVVCCVSSRPLVVVVRVDLVLTTVHQFPRRVHLMIVENVHQVLCLTRLQSIDRRIGIQIHRLVSVVIVHNGILGMLILLGRGIIRIIRKVGSGVLKFPRNVGVIRHQDHGSAIFIRANRIAAVHTHTMRHIILVHMGKNIGSLARGCSIDDQITGVIVDTVVVQQIDMGTVEIAAAGHLAVGTGADQNIDLLRLRALFFRDRNAAHGHQSHIHVFVTGTAADDGAALGDGNGIVTGRHGGGIVGDTAVVRSGLVKRPVEVTVAQRMLNGVKDLGLSIIPDMDLNDTGHDFHVALANSDRKRVKHDLEAYIGRQNGLNRHGNGQANGSHQMGAVHRSQSGSNIGGTRRHGGHGTVFIHGDDRGVTAGICNVTVGQVNGGLAYQNSAAQRLDHVGGQRQRAGVDGIGDGFAVGGALVLVEVELLVIGGNLLHRFGDPTDRISSPIDIMATIVQYIAHAACITVIGGNAIVVNSGIGILHENTAVRSIIVVGTSATHTNIRVPKLHFEEPFAVFNGVQFLIVLKRGVTALVLERPPHLLMLVRSQNDVSGADRDRFGLQSSILAIPNHIAT